MNQKLYASQPEHPVVCLSILDEFEYKIYYGEWSLSSHTRWDMDSAMKFLV